MFVLAVAVMICFICYRLNICTVVVDAEAMQHSVEVMGICKM
jgi:hypothetical protein